MVALAGTEHNYGTHCIEPRCPACCCVIDPDGAPGNEESDNEESELTANVVPLVGRPASDEPVFDPRQKESRDDKTVITQSELTTFMRDPRHWWLAYYRRLRKIRDFAYLPTVGNLYHAGLEAYYREKADPLQILQEKAQQLIAQELPEAAAQDLLKAAELAAIMLEGYLEWLNETGADADLEILGAEQKVEVRLGETPFVLRCKIDARARLRTSGFHAQLEHKTVGSLNDLPKYAQSNFQFLTYDLAAYLQAREVGDPSLKTDGVILNMARRVKRTARANPPFYGRHEVRHNTQELRAHYKHVVAVAGRIVEARALLDAGQNHHFVVPPNVTRDSSWSNPFLPVYALLDNGSDAEGYLAAEYELHDPLERYEETDE